MPELFGHTRAHVSDRHALVTPANHVPSSIPGFTGAEVVVLINPALGAGIAQTLVTFAAGGRAAPPLCEAETFGYVMNGSLTLSIGARRHRLGPGRYFFLPPRQAWSLSEPKPGTRLTFFQKVYRPLAGTVPPLPRVGDIRKVPAKPYLGDPAVTLQVLLPDDPSFDFGVNILSYLPGAHLPIVEIHVMEHGLIMLEGEGVYRLEDRWHPVRALDAIWMAPYCPQWFVAMGKRPAAYLYCKDINRAVL